MRNLLRRSLSGIIYVSIFVSAILFSKESYILLVAFFAIIAIYELSKITKFKSVIAYLLFGLTLFLMHKRPESYAIKMILAINIASSVYLIYQLFAKKEITFSTEREKLGLSIRYLIFSFCFLTLLPFYNQNYTPFLMISVLILIWVNDSFAFLVGKNFGKTKLFVSVSPKKTVEGFIGGFFFTLIAAYLISISLFSSDFSVLHWFAVASIISVIGTIGDLIESKLKRQAKIKDSGTIMPGHGGILDRLDSLLFAAPFVYLYINFII
ncbi:phosphatidate cytidylyltransferase [Polaribacter irgensii 23-P]|uniref:Phosphatidate cytidylyltransferase n=1 Tax=Polaribacter irgensii 23-P TaxID=313594 RepID=A4BZ13_9FLAO|nr:phosphatidate cytidylyltransferase [Polaribacter irgensii]EAR12406.1 phosphatidate cytidylyltransferase [Polaribacter irgensii 23-P]